MVFKLIGAPTSWNSLRARHILFEKGLEDEVELVDLSVANGDQKKPDHLAKNPFGKVPVLIDGDFTLFESRAIAIYLAAKYRDRGVPLIPVSPSPNELGLFAQSASIELTQFDSLAEPFVLTHVIAKFQKKIVPEKDTFDAVAAIKPKLDTLDGILSRQSYMAGEQFSLPDAFYMPLIHLIIKLGFQGLIFERPNLARWWDVVSQREAWKRSVEPFDKVYGF
ncbi:hypothetical protein N7486_005821 [Penicillium sp. IBT 16267x]|nr:hypothetical protein N7486_005821 [Penicillium sp. IBT 16267x]